MLDLRRWIALRAQVLVLDLHPGQTLGGQVLVTDFSSRITHICKILVLDLHPGVASIVQRANETLFIRTELLAGQLPERITSFFQISVTDLHIRWIVAVEIFVTAPYQWGSLVLK